MSFSQGIPRSSLPDVFLKILQNFAQFLRTPFLLNTSGGCFYVPQGLVLETLLFNLFLCNLFLLMKKLALRVTEMILLYICILKTMMSF